MKVGVVGTRQVSHINLEKFGKYIPKKCTLIVTGGAIGIDSIAETFAAKMGIKLQKITPNYKIFGKLAPIVRNTEIVKQSEMVIAFWDYKSRGTANTIKECIRLGVEVEIVNVTEISD